MVGATIASLVWAAVISAVIFSLMSLAAQFRMLSRYLITSDPFTDKIDAVARYHPRLANLVEDLSKLWTLFLFPSFVAILGTIVICAVNIFKDVERVFSTQNFPFISVYPLLIAWLILLTFIYFGFRITSTSQEVLKNCMKLREEILDQRLLEDKLYQRLLIYLHIGQQTGLHSFRIAGIMVNSVILQGLIAVSIFLVSLAYGIHLQID